MKTLSENWITEGWIDFEYKKYILLAYLKDVDQNFKKVKLYPPLADLIHHYGRLRQFADNKEQLKAAFPKLITHADLDKLKFNYKPLHIDDDTMQLLEDIVQYALPQLKEHIEEGKRIYDFLEGEMSIEPIGISPIYQKEGYVLLSQEKTKDILIYRYQINLFQNSVDRFKGIMLQFIKNVRHSLIYTFEHIKMSLVKEYKELPNPATYRIHSKFQLPVEESFIPISKRLLLRYVE
ncbi:hypothetical protein ACFOUP_15845 [Belliella kenyensis]|uniref:Uncharacterized protein n=1 Tax=Belliella kenyensis TaxID=1472724 RepID=A0ABV8EQ63_9BACT|nr:hypothetical protein [Belliella kenyensis]MCH7401969.1 hypothetical protein [Belliella kenyensis]MDN3605133.1 hypothetical protein [Belliella kenyensis]